MARPAAVNEAVVYAAAMRPTRVSRRFVVVTRGRTGSTLLMSLLGSHPRIAADDEVLRSRRRALLLYLRGRERLTTRRVPSADTYGFKLLASQLVNEQRPAHRTTLVPRLHERGWTVLHLARRDPLRVAVSNVAARVIGFHHGDPVERGPLELDPKAVRRYLENTERAARFEREVLRDVPRMELVYERDLEDAAMHQATADAVFERLGLSPHPVRAATARSLSPRLSDVMANVDALRAELAGTPFADLLDASPDP